MKERGKKEVKEEGKIDIFTENANFYGNGSATFP